MNSLYQFLDNKYTAIYWKIVARARSRSLTGYIEKHHVIPRSLLKTDDVIALTAREHLHVHLLLTKMTEGTAKYKMLWALHRMCSGSKIHHPERTIPSSRAYAQARKEFIILLKQPKSEDHKRKISAALKGHKVSQKSIDKLIERNKNVSPETKLKRSQALKGKPKSDDHRRNMAKPKSEDHKRKISEALKGRYSPLTGRPSH